MKDYPPWPERADPDYWLRLAHRWYWMEFRLWYGETRGDPLPFEEWLAGRAAQ